MNLDVNDNRMLKAEWQSNRLVCTNTVGLVASASVSTVGWYEFNTANPAAVMHQEGFIPGSTQDASTFFPSIAIAPDGDLGMTYMESSPSEYLSMYVTGQPVSQYEVANSKATPRWSPPNSSSRASDPTPGVVMPTQPPV